MANQYRIPKGKYILRATPPKTYFLKNKAEFPSKEKANEYSEKISGKVQTEKDILKEASPIVKELENKGGGYLVFRNLEGKDYVFEVEGKEKLNTYNFIFNHKEYGFLDYDKDNYQISKRINKQVEDNIKLSKGKVLFSITKMNPVSEGTRITANSNMDKKTAKKFADMNGWAFVD